MSIRNLEQHFVTSPELQPIEHSPEHELGETLSFVDLVVFASEYSEDEGEVRDLVDLLFERDQHILTDLRHDRIPCA
jgi:hypothetical protein